MSGGLTCCVVGCNDKPIHFGFEPGIDCVLNFCAHHHGPAPNLVVDLTKAQAQHDSQMLLDRTLEVPRT